MRLFLLDVADFLLISVSFITDVLLWSTVLMFIGTLFALPHFSDMLWLAVKLSLVGFISIGILFITRTILDEVD